MPDKHKPGPDGLIQDGTPHYPANEHDLQSYRDASQALSQFTAPVMVSADRPNERLFVAAFDGTGNDADRDPEHITNVGKIRDQIREHLERQDNPQLAVGYVEGPGTQRNVLAKAWDGARGHTYDERLERMYEIFIDQAKRWKQENPDAEIRVADIGFSRGAEQAAGFARLVHERGIQDPAGARYQRDSDGNIKGVEYTKPALVPPGEVAQAVGLFDPVGTGEPVAKHDRRLPPSVISALQISAEDERRSLFKGSPVVPPGASEDGRFLNVTVGGAHSDIGGSYHRDGLAARSGNLQIDYLNALAQPPFLQKMHEPDDPRLNVVHQSHKGSLLYRLTGEVDRAQPEGQNPRLVPKGMDVADPFHPEPRDEALNARFPRQAVPIGPVPDAQGRLPEAPSQTPQTLSAPSAPAEAGAAGARSPQAQHIDGMLDRLIAGAQAPGGDYRHALREAAEQPAGQDLRREAVAGADRAEQAWAAQQAQQAASQEQQQGARQPRL